MQLAPAANVLGLPPQLVSPENPSLLMPPPAITKSTDAPVVFVTTTSCDTAATPTGTSPKSNDLGDTDNGNVPVPLNDTGTVSAADVGEPPDQIVTCNDVDPDTTPVASGVHV